MAKPARRRAPRRNHRGVALIALLAVIMLGSAWMLMTRLNEGSANFTAQVRARNAEVLKRAKLALIGYVAAQTAKSYEDNPGALPCPEHAWYIDQPTKEGGAGPSVGVSNPGYGTGNCSSIGRFPWRTIGTEKFVDASGEPLWYVVGPTWRKTSTSTQTFINSTTSGDLTVDGENVVALIIAPGPAMKASAGTTAAGATCAARNQVRSAPSGTMDPLDYLECYNAATLQFSAAGPSASYDAQGVLVEYFNDQVVPVTAADLLPGIEAAIANRMEREIAPLVTGVYSANSSWGSLTTLLPMANTFSVASTNANAFAGTPAWRGLLPLSYAETTAGSGTACTPGTTPPNYCEPNFVLWSASGATATLSSGSGSIAHWSSSCSVTTATTTTLNCTAYGIWLDGPVPTVNATISATASNAAAALRTFNTGVTLSGIDTGYTATAALASSGNATVTISGVSPSTNGVNAGVTACGLSSFFESSIDCYRYTFSVPIFVLADHPNIHTLLDSNDGTTGWFVRNKWHLLSYYAIASAVGPGGSGSCVTSSTCLRVTYHPDDGKQRGIVLLAGRAIGSQDRSSSTLSNWLEGTNATATGSSSLPFEVRSATLLTNKTFNDRVAVLSSN